MALSENSQVCSAFQVVSRAANVDLVFKLVVGRKEFIRQMIIRNNYLGLLLRTYVISLTFSKVAAHHAQFGLYPLIPFDPPLTLRLMSIIKTSPRHVQLSINL